MAFPFVFGCLLQCMIGGVSDEIEGPIEYIIVAFRRARDLRSLGTKFLDRSWARKLMVREVSLRVFGSILDALRAPITYAVDPEADIRLQRSI